METKCAFFIVGRKSWWKGAREKIYGQKKQLGDREAKKKEKRIILEDFKQACHNSAKGLTLSVSPRWYAWAHTDMDSQ